jgi:hypothetical protein
MIPSIERRNKWIGFEKLTGFAETNSHDTRKKLRVGAAGPIPPSPCDLEPLQSGSG